MATELPLPHFSAGTCSLSSVQLGLACCSLNSASWWQVESLSALFASAPRANLRHLRQILIQGSQNWAGVHALSVSGGTEASWEHYRGADPRAGDAVRRLPNGLPASLSRPLCKIPCNAWRKGSLLLTAALLPLPSQHACSQDGSGPLHLSTPAFSGCSAGF